MADMRAHIIIVTGRPWSCYARDWRRFVELRAAQDAIIHDNNRVELIWRTLVINRVQLQLFLQIPSVTSIAGIPFSQFNFIPQLFLKNVAWELVKLGGSPSDRLENIFKILF